MTHIKKIFFIIALLTVVMDINAQAESRRSTRSNSDKCCPDKVYIEGSGGKNKEIKIDLFNNEKTKGPVEVYILDQNEKPIDLSKSISFSKDDKTLKIDTRDTFPPHSIILEFRASGKSDKIKISNLKSWPPDAKK